MRTTLTAFVPAHKQTNSEHAPGQQVNPVNPLGFTDTTLGDYIRRKDKIHGAFDAAAKEQKECCGNPLRTGPNGRGCENCPPPKKLTFDEYYKNNWEEFHSANLSLDDADSCRYLMLMAWNAAQENK